MSRVGYIPDRDAWGNKICQNLSLLFPALQRSNRRAIPWFSIGNINHSSCCSRQEAEFNKPARELSTCTHIPNVTGESNKGNYSALYIPWADVWWCYGKKNLCDLFLKADSKENLEGSYKQALSLRVDVIRINPTTRGERVHNYWMQPVERRISNQTNSQHNQNLHPPNHKV